MMRLSSADTSSEPRPERARERDVRDGRLMAWSSPSWIAWGLASGPRVGAANVPSSVSRMADGMLARTLRDYDPMSHPPMSSSVSMGASARMDARLIKYPI